MRVLALILLLAGCAHAPVRLLCYGEPRCVKVEEGLWSCSCPSLDEDYPSPGEQRWYVMRTP